MIQSIKNEYVKEGLYIKDYKVTVFGIPIYTSRFTTTNTEALKKFTAPSQRKHRVCGFTINNNKNETKP